MEVYDGGSLVNTNIGGFVRGKDHRLGAPDPAGADLRAIDQQGSHTALADARTFVGKFPADGGLAGGELFLRHHAERLDGSASRRAALARSTAFVRRSGTDRPTGNGSSPVSSSNRKGGSA